VYSETLLPTNANVLKYVAQYTQELTESKMGPRHSFVSGVTAFYTAKCTESDHLIFSSVYNFGASYFRNWKQHDKP